MAGVGEEFPWCYWGSLPARVRYYECSWPLSLSDVDRRIGILPAHGKNVCGCGVVVSSVAKPVLLPEVISVDQPSPRIEVIQDLRGFAALSVCWYHYAY